MNKRIKKKVMKRAIQKYDNKEILSAKEIKMITPYIFIDIFDFDLFRKKVSELMNAFAKAFAQALQTVSEHVANFAESLEVKEVEELEAELLHKKQSINQVTTSELTEWKWRKCCRTSFLRLMMDM